MKAAGYSICVLIAGMLMQACSNTGAHSQQLKTLDSLSGTLNATIKELEKTDTVLLQKAVTRFAHYRQFIQQSINDTIAKADADNLQQFYSSGGNLEVFQSNRSSLLARAHLVNSQLLRLSADVKSNAVNAEQAQRFILQEKNEAANLADLGSMQKELFYSGLEAFKASLRGVELLIKSHNHGALPTIVKDTLAL
jgi:hypothetical protein